MSRSRERGHAAVLHGRKRNAGRCPRDVIADQGFDQSLKKQENYWGGGA